MGCTVVAQMKALIIHWYLVNILLIGMNHDYGFIVVPSSGERRWWLDVHWWYTTGGQDVPGIVGTVDRGKGRMSVGKPDGHVGVYPDNKVHGVNMGPIWVLSAPDGPHVCFKNLAIKLGTLLAGRMFLGLSAPRYGEKIRCHLEILDDRTCG